MMENHPYRLVICAAGLLIGTAASGQTAAETRFEDLSRRVQREPGAVSKENFEEFLRLGVELGRPATASAAARGYLAVQRDPDPQLLRRGAEAAFLAGDLRTAVARYRQYLQNAAPSAESSQSAARLASILIDYLNSHDEGYWLLAEEGARFRGHISMRKFDSWFMDQARERKDHAALAQRLALVLEQKLPYEMEFFLTRHHLEWLMTEISAARPVHFPAAAQARRAAALVREDAMLAAKYRFIAANLAFIAGATGKENDVLEKEFAAVAAAARAYIDADASAESVRTVMLVFSGGINSYSAALWEQQAGQKRQVFVYGFDKVADPDRAALMGWILNGAPTTWTASPEQWVQLGTRHADLFRRAPETSTLPFVTRSADPAVFKTQTVFLDGVPSASAAIINSLAAADTADLYPAVNHLLQKESWHLPAGDLWKLLNESIRPVFMGYTRTAEQALPERYFERLHYRVGRELFARSPWALLHPDAGPGYVLHAWSFSGSSPDDKSQMAAVLRSLDWVAYTEAQRRAVFGPAYDEYRKWADEAGKRLSAATKANTDAPTAETAAALKRAQADVALATALETEFKKALDPAIADPTKAPGPLAQQLARAVAAAQANDPVAFAAAAKAAYAQVREYETRRIPFGRATVDYLLSIKAPFNLIDWQAMVMADRLKLLGKDAPNRGAHWAMASIIAARGWNFNFRQLQAAEKDNALKINDVLAKALHEQIAANWLWAPAFDWFRRTRLGANWQEQGRNADVLEKMIEKNILLQPDAPRFGSICAASSYQWLIRNEFQPLNAKFPEDSAFDDSFAEEIRATKRLDMIFFNYSQDRGRKVANALAEWFSTFERLPYLRDRPALVLDRDVFWQAQGRILNAESAIRAAALQKLGEYFGKTRFDDFATGRISLNELPKPENDEQRAAYFAALKQYLDRIAPLPWRSQPPRLTHLAALGPANRLSDAEITLLKRFFTDAEPWGWRGDNLNEVVAAMLAEALTAKNRVNELFELVPVFWKFTRDTGNTTFQNDLARLGGTLAGAGHEELAAALAVAGMEMLGARMPEALRGALQGIRAKSLAASGALIPVERADARYPIYAAQAAFAQDKLEEAWEQYRRNQPLALRELRNLSTGFSLWLVQKHTAAAEYGEAEALAQELVQWMDGAPQAFDPETRARLLLGIADIAFARQEYPRARAQYERLALNKALDGTTGQRDAELRMAETDRLTRNFDRAVQLLEQLARRRDPYLQAQAGYQLALVRFDQEDYADVREILNQVFAIDPNHQLARILEGRLYLQMRKLIEATDVKVGIVADQRVIVPGRPLKVQLEDRTLAVAGAATAIEIRAWTASGDEEIFNLLPFGDSQTRFEGQIPTVLGTAAKGDRVLQVRGGDTVHYDFSERFKAANKIAGTQPSAIRVVSDAALYVSSGEIMTREEEERRSLENMMREKLQRDGAVASAALSTLRNRDEIKPGNPVHIRVVDPDRSIGTGRDTIVVRAATGAGDRVDQVVLTETAPDSGVFEGKVKTASAPATAFASDSEEGRDPNSAITGADYPAWIALGDNRRPKIFSVDLNRGVAPAEMKVFADEPMRALRQFVVQTSPNGRDFVNAGSWPPAFKAWDGGLRMELTRLAGAASAPSSLKEWREYMDIGYLVAKSPLLALEHPAMQMEWAGGKAGGHAAALQLKSSGADSWVLGRVSGYFLQPRRQLRSFRIEHDSRLPNIRYFLTINGATQPGKAHEFNGVLNGGLHRVDVWFAVRYDAEPSWTLLCDIPEPPYMAPCPPEMFSLQGDDLAGAGFEPALIEADEAKTVFTVRFAQGTQARTIRLWLLDFEREAPAIRRLTLTDAVGEVILPTKEDIVKLRRNDLLEVIPGDRISVVYEDPSFIDKSRQVLEAGLTATFHNGTIHACFVDSTLDGQGNRQPRYVPMRRYRPGDAVSVFIHDPDLDVTTEPDRVSFRAVNRAGTTVEVVALETAAHSGTFIGRVFPVEGVAQRPSEITVGAGEDLVLIYRDEENTAPGIPWERRAVIEPVVDVTPRLYVYDVSSRPLGADESRAETNAPGSRDEFIPATRSLAITRRPLDADENDAPPTAMHGVPLVMDLIYPTIVLSPESTAELFLQTAAGRRRNGLGPDEPFDPAAPGTVRLVRTPGGSGSVSAPPGYRQVLVRGNPQAPDALDEGRFTFIAPIALGPLPESSAAPAADGGKRNAVPELLVRGDDEIFAGFRWTGADGIEQWITRRIPLRRDVFFDVMDQRYQQPLSSLFVGESLFLRVMDPALDLTDAKDVAEVHVRTASGGMQSVSLVETLETSGIFKGALRLAFAGDTGRAAEDGVLSVQYGDTLTLIYRPGAEEEEIQRTVSVFQGADGQVLPFTKRFADPEIAVQTQFTMAEAYFEQAKKYRTLNQEDLSRAVIAQGRRLLEEAIREYPATEARAQAEYLLAELALEYANDAAGEPDRQQRFFMEAIGRFSDIVALYPESAYAPKAQYKKALAFEKAGQIDEASAEYVKLAYRYPENELVAETIARLGQYFLAKGREMEEQASAASDPVAAESARRQALEMYRTSAEVFGRLAGRFPNHHLAGRTQVLSAQSYMRAQEWRRAIAVFDKVIEARSAEPDLIAQAMYWAADCHMKGGSPDMTAAYRLFKRLTWDYPESQWAKYARGRLTESQMVAIETNEGKNR